MPTPPGTDPPAAPGAGAPGAGASGSGRREPGAAPVELARLRRDAGFTSARAEQHGAAPFVASESSIKNYESPGYRSRTARVVGLWLDATSAGDADRARVWELHAARHPNRPVHGPPTAIVPSGCRTSRGHRWEWRAGAMTLIEDRS